MRDRTTPTKNLQTMFHRTFGIFLFLLFHFASPLTANLFSKLPPAFQNCRSKPIIQGPFNSIWYAGCSDSSHNAILQAHNMTTGEWLPILDPQSDMHGVPGIVNFVVAEVATDAAFAVTARAKKTAKKRQHHLRQIYIIGQQCSEDDVDKNDCEHQTRSLIVVRQRDAQQSKFNQVSTLHPKNDCGLLSASPRPLVWSTVRHSLFSVCSISGEVLAVGNGGSKLNYLLGETANCLADNVALSSKQDVLYLSCSPSLHSTDVTPHIAAWNLDYGVLLQLQHAESRCPPVGERWRIFVPPIRPVRDGIKQDPQLYYQPCPLPPNGITAAPRSSVRVRGLQPGITYVNPDTLFPDDSWVSFS